MISNLSNLIELFAKMQTNDFDTDSALKWGFYFVDSDKKKLMLAYNELEESKYFFEKIYKTKEAEKWVLFASKIDTLTPEKLHRRNLAFNKLAEYCDVELYDGWDVERLPTVC